MSADTINTEEDAFQDDVSGWASRWAMEFEAAKKELKTWHEQGKKVVERFLDKGATGIDNQGRGKQRRLALYTSNVQTLQAITYGKTPKVDVSRKFADSEDDPARVAGVMMERLANGDIQKDSDTYAVAMNHVLEDRYIPGMGNARVRYVADFEDGEEKPAKLDPVTGKELAPAVPATQTKSYECVEVDYVPWRDQLWSPARFFGEVRWWAFRSEVSRADLVEKFGEEVGQRLPLNAKRSSGSDSKDSGNKRNPWSRCDLWEIWDKENECTWWYVEGFGEVLKPVDAGAEENGAVPDPLQLEGFWPFPLPFIANTTTSGFVPQSDYVMSQDLYEEVNDYTTRIYRLQQAIKVAGLYNKSAGSSVGRLLNEGGDNELIEVDNWAMFAEAGGVKGNIDWLPLDQIVAALDKLRELRQESIQLLYQVSGFSDIMRGQASDNTTATEQSIKAKFASVRVQRLQDEFARFCSDVQKLKLEVISKHFEPQTIIEQSNIMRTADGKNAPLIQAAVQLIKSDFYQYRIEVKPESVSLTDYAALRTERTEFVQGLTQFIESAGPLAQGMPQSAPYLMALLKWFITGFKGSSEMQGVLDEAITAAEQAQQQAAANPQPPKPDPKMQAIQAKAAADKQHTMDELQAHLASLSAEAKTAVQQHAAESTIEVQEEAAKQRIKDPMTAMFSPTGVR